VLLRGNSAGTGETRATAGEIRAYRKLVWFFPQHGHVFTPENAIDVCGEFS
jgi:hypothetical protein